MPSILVLLFLPIASASSDWWDTDWQYRKPITITNNNETLMQNGYTVDIIINTGILVANGKLLANCNDLRIAWYNASSNSEVELDRNVINPNSASTTVQFRTQAEILGNGNDSNYYMYYGDPSAGMPPTNNKNIYKYFNNFDDEAEGSIPNGWIVESGVWNITDNHLRQWNPSGLTIIYIDPSILNVKNFEMEFWMDMQVGSYHTGGVFRFINYNTWEFYTITMHETLDMFRFEQPNVKDINSSFFDINDNLKGIIKIRAIDDRFWFYWNGILKFEATDDSLNSGSIGFTTSYRPSIFYDLLLKLLIYPEPTLSLGQEEVKSPTPPIPTPVNVTVKLSGELDFERWGIMVVALVRDQKGNPISNATVLLDIYSLNKDGVWVSNATMNETVFWGVYKWSKDKENEKECDKYWKCHEISKKLEKGLYIAKVMASVGSGPVATDMIEFHIDPPEESFNIYSLITGFIFSTFFSIFV
jgi:hypothetical protein